MNVFKLLVLVLVLSPLHARAIDNNVALNGASMYTEIGHTYYVGGLYLDEPSNDLNTILAPDTRKVMQLVVTKNTWSKRSWTRHWRNRIAINNPDATNDSEAFSALGQFTTMVKEQLVRGDEVVVEYRPGMTEIRLNGERVLQARGPAVMKYLLMTWIGSIPPSSGFRREILQGPAGSSWESNKRLLTGYQLPVGRTNLYSSWVERDKVVKEEEERKLAEIKAAAEEKRRQAELALAARQKAEKEKAAREKAERERKAQVAAAEAARRKSPAAEPRVERAVAVVEKAVTKTDDEAARERAQEQAYYRSLLDWQMQRYVAKNVEYPHWARNFSEEGLVDVKFALNSTKDVKFLDRSNNVDSMLVKEVERVIKKGASILTFPSAMKGDSWDIDVSYLFSLNGDVLPEDLPPIMPQHMEERAIPEEDQVALIERYRNELVKSVRDIIVYPERAKMSRHRGRIAAKITVDRWGEVRDIEMVKETRFDYLNESVIDAIRQNSPFKIFPLEIAADSIVVELQHRFQ